ncbi:MAG: hypothetical protein AB1656_01515 [Candidatus Omnitrophota bacterium]
MNGARVRNTTLPPTDAHTPTNTPTNTPASTPTPAWTFTPTPTATFTPTQTPTPTTPAATPTAKSISHVFVYDDPAFPVDLTGATDFDDAGAAALTIAWDADKGAATGWDIFVRQGLRGSQFLARVNNADAFLFEWKKDSANLASAFQNGPDYNAAYSFRVVRLDGQVGTEDFFDMSGFVGLNLTGGNNIRLTQPAMPNLRDKEIAVYDDILGGNNLSLSGEDVDESNWRALQIAWNFNADPSTVQDYRVLIREKGETQFKSLGQTNSGKITYFWWTQDQAFTTTAEFKDGPQPGKTYQFRVVKFAFDGSRDGISSGYVKYAVRSQ